MTPACATAAAPSEVAVSSHEEAVLAEVDRLLNDGVPAEQAYVMAEGIVADRRAGDPHGWAAELSIGAFSKPAA